MNKRIFLVIALLAMFALLAIGAAPTPQIQPQVKLSYENLTTEQLAKIMQAGITGLEATCKAKNLYPDYPKNPDVKAAIDWACENKISIEKCLHYGVDIYEGDKDGKAKDYQGKIALNCYNNVFGLKTPEELTTQQQLELAVALLNKDWVAVVKVLKK